MLVVTANWSISDGTLTAAGGDLSPVWLPVVHRAALRAGFRRDGTYRPVGGIDLVLAGDTFDWLTSRIWTSGVRPWQGGPRARAARMAVTIATVRRGRRLLAALAKWGLTGLSIPTADRLGRPRLELMCRIPVRVTLLSGDRDRWLDSTADAAATRGCGVGRVWSDGDVVVRHGDELDPLCGDCEADPIRPDCERQPTLGESLAVDLVARFGGAVLDVGAGHQAVRRLVSTLSRIGPSDIPGVFTAWRAAPDGGGGLPAAVRERVVTAWREAVAAWHQETQRMPPVCGMACSACDTWAGWLDTAGAVDGADRAGARAPAELAECFAPAVPGTGERGWPPRRTRDGGPTASVLGHPPALPDTGGPWPVYAGPVCLGPPAPQPWRGVPPTPLTVTARRTEQGIVWEWLLFDPAGAATVAMRPAGGDHGRMPCVDAA